jgi:hypothetical protein
MILMIVAAVCPPSSEPANSQFFRLCQTLHNRKNWYFLGSDAGGETAEVLMSLISTCKRHGVEPYAYFKDVITRLTNEPGCELKDLLPNNWKQQQPISLNAQLAVA